MYTRCGIDVARLGSKPAMDLRSALGSWVSERIDTPQAHRVLCVEDIALVDDVAFDNVFAALALLEAKGFEVNTLALPLLGAGGAHQDAALVMQSVLASAKRHLVRLQCLSRVLFVERNEARARAFDRAMDDALGRHRVVLPRGALMDSVRNDILSQATRNRHGVSEAAGQLLDELVRVLQSPQARSFEIRIVARRLLEFIVSDLPGHRKGPLWQQIESLAETGVADWMRSYMHTLRVFGNEAAHDRRSEARTPAHITEQDLAMCLFCLERVLSFWLGTKTQVD